MYKLKSATICYCKAKTIRNKPFFLLNLPFYLLSQIEKNINFMIYSVGYDKSKMSEVLFV